MHSIFFNFPPKQRTGPGLSSALIVAWILACHASGWADETNKGEPSVVEPGAVEVRFTDGGLLKMTLLEDQVEIVTPSGKKAVRLTDLRKVELALRIPEGETRLIEAAIRNLGSKTFKERERASSYLLRRGLRSYPALLAATKDGDIEARRRATVIIDTLRESLPDDLFELRTSDIVYTTEGKLTGKIGQESWKAMTAQFGVVQVKLADVARAVSQAHPEPIDEKLVSQPDPGTLTGLQGQIGKVFAFRVTGALQGNVWGTGTYTSDSTLAVAAVHAGVLRVGQTRTIKVRVVTPLTAYVGSTQNGVTTRGYGPWDGAYEIIK